MTLSISKLSMAVTIILGLLTTGGTAASDFPTRPMTLVVPFPAGIKNSR